MEKETDPYTTVTISTIILILRRALFVQLQLHPNNLSIKRHRNRGIPTKQPPTPANHKHHGRAEPSLYLRVDDLAVLAEGARERALRGVPRQPAHEDPSHLILRHPGSNQIEIPSPPAATTCTGNLATKSHQKNRNLAPTGANRHPLKRGGRGWRRLTSRGDLGIARVEALGFRERRSGERGGIRSVLYISGTGITEQARVVR